MSRIRESPSLFQLVEAHYEQVAFLKVLAAAARGVPPAKIAHVGYAEIFFSTVFTAAVTQRGADLGSLFWTLNPARCSRRQFLGSPRSTEQTSRGAR